MTEMNEVYKCNMCGNIVEVVHASVGGLVCCGEAMELLTEKTQDQGLEKHVPVIEKTTNGVLVKVGSLEHPMLPEHHIEWIEIIADGRVYRKELKAGDAPQAEFCVDAKTVVAREYCNVHGHWKSS